MSALAPLFEVFRAALLKDIRVAFPARVESYDANQQTCSVQPLVRDFFEDEEGNTQTDRLPVVTDCPVVWPSGGGAFITLPLQKGDTGLVVGTDRSLDVWLSQGGEVSPGDVRCHNLSDGVFLPGIVPTSSPRSGSSGSHLVINAPSSGEIHIGQLNPTYAVALAQNVKTALDQLNTAISSAIVVPGPDGGASFKSGLIAGLAAVTWPPTNLGSTTVKVKG